MTEQYNSKGSGTVTAGTEMVWDETAFSVLKSYERTLTQWADDDRVPEYLREDLRKFMSWFRPIQDALRALVTASTASRMKGGMKALEWSEEEDADGIWAWVAAPHRYEVFHEASDVETKGVQLAHNRDILGFYPSVDEAKAAAQAHYAALAATETPNTAPGEVSGGDGWQPPKGWVLVPEEPTLEMLNAAVDVDSFKLGDISPLGFRISPQMLFEQCYAAMVAAAPPSPRYAGRTGR
jgi:hypothetical protein